MPYIPPVSSRKVEDGESRRESDSTSDDHGMEDMTKGLSKTSISQREGEEEGEEHGGKEESTELDLEVEDDIVLDKGNKRSDSTPSLCTTDISESEANSVISLEPESEGTEKVGVRTEGEDGGKDDEIVKYKRGMLAYTRDLYHQAKLSESRKAKTAAAYSSQFGLKQSGMEKMAAKKALTKRLNG